MTLSIANLRYIDAAHTQIDMDVTLDGEVLPFTYAPGDQSPVTSAIAELLSQGTYTVAPYVAPAVDLHALAASVRWQKEVGGITLNGIPIATDRESQAMISGAYNFVQQNPAAIIKWKAEHGFVALDAAQITALALAVGSHVQACFAKEAEVVAGIEADPPTISTVAEIDAAFAALTTTY